MFNFHAAEELKDSESTDESASSVEQNPAWTERATDGDEDTTEFRDPYVDPVTGDWILNEFDIECISIGAGILGCGGGGSPYLGRLRALQLIKAGKEICVIHPYRYVCIKFL